MSRCRSVSHAGSQEVRDAVPPARGPTRSSSVCGRNISAMRPQMDACHRIRALTFEVTVDLVESLGAEKYVYFTTSGGIAESEQLDGWPPESGGGKPVMLQGFRLIREGNGGHEAGIGAGTPPNCMYVRCGFRGRNLSLR